MIPAAIEASDVKLGRGPKLAAHRQRQAIERRDASRCVRLRSCPLMEPAACNTAYDPADPGKSLLRAIR